VFTLTGTVILVKHSGVQNVTINPPNVMYQLSHTNLGSETEKIALFPRQIWYSSIHVPLRTSSDKIPLPKNGPEKFVQSL